MISKEFPGENWEKSCCAIFTIYFFRAGSEGSVEFWHKREIKVGMCSLGILTQKT